MKKKEDDLAWRENKNTTAKNSIGLKSVWRETNLKRLTVNIDFYTRYRRQIFIVREFNKLCTRFGGLTYAVMWCSFFHRCFYPIFHSCYSISHFLSPSLSLFLCVSLSLTLCLSRFLIFSLVRSKEKERTDRMEKNDSRISRGNGFTSYAVKNRSIMQVLDRKGKEAHGEISIFVNISLRRTLQHST